MAINDLYELTVHYHLPSAPCTCVFGYKQTVGTNDKDTLQSAVDFWIANTLPFWVAMLALDVDTDQIRMDQVSVGNEQPGFTNLLGTPGDVAGQALPAGSSMVISWVTDAPNAKHNGRVYIAGCSEEELNNGNISVLQLVENNLFGVQILTTLQTSLPQDAKFELVTISRVLNGAPRVPPVGFLALSHVSRLPMFTQSRRITKQLGLN